MTDPEIHYVLDEPVPRPPGPTWSLREFWLPILVCFVLGAAGGYWVMDGVAVMREARRTEGGDKP
jgi:hypothetical protein